MSTDLAERAQGLVEQLDNGGEAVTWRHDDPEHPNLIVGELYSVSAGIVRTGPAAGQRRQIAHIRAVDGQLWNVWLLHKVLIDEFVMQQPKPGEMIAVRYDGRNNEAAQPYEKFTLRIDRRHSPEAVRFEPVAGTDAAGVTHHEPAPAPAPEPPVQPPAARVEPAGDTIVRECEACGMRNGYHAAQCPLAGRGEDDIPF